MKGYVWMSSVAAKDTLVQVSKFVSRPAVLSNVSLLLSILLVEALE